MAFFTEEFPLSDRAISELAMFRLRLPFSMVRNMFCKCNPPEGFWGQKKEDNFTFILFDGQGPQGWWWLETWETGPF